MEKIIITVGWWFGSRGREIEKKIAQKLRIPYYDKKLLVVVAKESGLALNFLPVSYTHLDVYKRQLVLIYPDR